MNFDEIRPPAFFPRPPVDAGPHHRVFGRDTQPTQSNTGVSFCNFVISQGTGKCKKKACRPKLPFVLTLPPAPQVQCWVLSSTSEFTETGFYFARLSAPIFNQNQH